MKKSNQTRPSDETKGAIELQEVHHRHMSFLFFSFFFKKKNGQGDGTNEAFLDCLSEVQPISKCTNQKNLLVGSSILAIYQ